MVSDLLVYELLLFGLLWLCVILHGLWPYGRAAGCQTTPTPATPPRKRSSDPQPFPGLTHKPHCAACKQSEEPAPQPPCCPPPRMVSARGRRREVDTSNHFCPHPTCDYAGWVGRGNIRANGHPSGDPWRQLHCRGRCQLVGALHCVAKLLHGDTACRHEI